MPPAPRPSPTPTLPRTSSARRLAALALLLVLPALVLPRRAPAQIRPETPGRVRADTRRAQRPDRHAALPPNYESHLDRRNRQLRRGEGDQPRPEGAEAYDYQTGNSPSASDRNVWGVRRKKKATANPQR